MVMKDSIIYIYLLYYYYVKKITDFYLIINLEPFITTTITSKRN